MSINPSDHKKDVNWFKFAKSTWYAFTKSLEEDGLLVAKIRLGDKYKRFSALIKQENLVKDESIEDTLLDMASYAIMTVMFNRNK